MHLWVVGVLALLWNLFGLVDFSATMTRWEPYMGNYSAEQLDYFYGFPAWANAVWGIAVITSVLGSIGLLSRRDWAVWMFGVAIVAMAVTSLYNLVLSDGVAMMGGTGIAFTVVIWLVAIFLFLYARRMSQRGVLR